MSVEISVLGFLFDFPYASQRFRELGSFSLQHLPLNLPLLVSLPHCRQLSTLGGQAALALLQLLLSVSKHCAFCMNSYSDPPMRVRRI